MNDFNFNAEFPYNRYSYSKWYYDQTHDKIIDHFDKLINHYVVCIHFDSVVNVNNSSNIECNINNLFQFDGELKEIFIESKYLDRNVPWLDYENIFIIYDDKCVLGLLFVYIEKSTQETHRKNLIVTKCSIVARNQFEHQMNVEYFDFECFNGLNTLRFGDRKIVENIEKMDEISMKKYSINYVYHAMPSLRVGDHSEILHELGFCGGSPRYCCSVCDFDKRDKTERPTPETCKWNSRTVMTNYLNVENAIDIERKKGESNDFTSSMGIQNACLIPMEIHQIVPGSKHVDMGNVARILGGCCVWVNSYGNGAVQLAYENKLQAETDFLQQQIDDNQMLIDFFNGKLGVLNELTKDKTEKKIKELTQANEWLQIELNDAEAAFNKVVNDNKEKVIIKEWYQLLKKRGINVFYCHENSVTGNTIKHLIEHRYEIVEFIEKYDKYLSELLSILLLHVKTMFILYNEKFMYELSCNLIALGRRNVIEFHELLIIFLKYTSKLGSENERIGIKHHLLYHCQEWTEYTGVGPGILNESNLEHIHQTAAPWFNFYKHYKKHDKFEFVMNRSNYQAKYYPQRKLLK